MENLMQKQLSPKDIEIIQDEETRYSNCYNKIRKAFSKNFTYLEDDEKIARQLTAEIVATRKDEEKDFLRSDENVAHELTSIRLKQADSLSELSKQPYFARVVYHENNRDVEFRLGVASFPEERIIDWRKGPISKLYYDYEEGEEYDEEIADKERCGIIKLKRAFMGKNENLSHIETKNFSYSKRMGKWQKNKKQIREPFSINDKKQLKEILKSHGKVDLAEIQESDGYLSQILSLLSKEQFALISENTNQPVIIQGSAGTGKTTIALHRLAWLLFEDNSDIRSEQTMVIMFNKTLAEYVKNVLPSLGVQNVKIATYFEWAKDVIYTNSKSKIRIEHSHIPVEVAKIKSKYEVLSLLKKFSRSYGDDLTFQEILIKFYQSEIFKSFVEQFQKDQITRKYLSKQTEKMFFDAYDVPFLLHILHEQKGYFQSKNFIGSFDHLVLDEVQDFNVAEIQSLMLALNNENQVTLAGDLGQKILANRDFGSWQELLTELGLSHIDVLNLSIAYRSTYQIYEVAEHIRDPEIKNEDLKLVPKFGLEPVLTICHHDQDAIKMTRNWIEDIININQKATAAIICKTSQEARSLYNTLLKIGVRGIRYGDTHHFEFTPGVVVTDIRAVKGLEFQAVLLYNPSQKNYSHNSDLDRNLLYVGITRAIYKLDMICYEEPSKMWPEFIEYNDLTKPPEEIEEEQEDEIKLLDDELVDEEEFNSKAEIAEEESELTEIDIDNIDFEEEN